MFGGCLGFPVIFLFPSTLSNGAVGAQGVGGFGEEYKIPPFASEFRGQCQLKNGSGILKP